MKPLPKPPGWLPAVLHLAHGLIAGGVGYMLTYSAVVWWVAEPGSPRSLMAITAAVALGVFEIAFFYFLWSRRQRMRRLWRDAADYLRKDDFESARACLLELLSFPEYRLAPQPVLFALGAAAEGMGNDREALVLYRRCGDFVPALRAMGLLQLERGFNESAAESLRKLVIKRKDDTFDTVLLSIALFRAGHRGAVRKVLQRALEERPKSEILRMNLARVEKGEEPAFTLDPTSEDEASPEADKEPEA
jgi:tetratricopeptide (TPR) repeat protein